MNKAQLYKALDYVNHSREKRMEMAILVSKNPQLVDPLLEIAFNDTSLISSKACWVLEFTAKENLPFLFQYLDEFTANIASLKLDSSVRPMAKICEYLTKAYFQKKDKKVIAALTEKHLEEIASACFDWLIGNHKVAAQAYSMTCLLLLGRKYDWIHPELKLMLEQNYANGSAAYKARARLTLAKIKG
ncbi:MAG: adenylosuccinate lyase [Maribacter sp.]